MNTRAKFFAACMLAAALLSVHDAFAAKPVRIVVAFPAGGGTDIVARLLAPKLAELWREQVIVDNRSGASGVIGTEIAARAPADGHTLFLATMGNLTVNPHLFPQMTVDPARDFAPVTQVVAVHFVLVAHPSLPARDVQELIALAKARPGAIHYSSSGAGGAPHLSGELFKSMAGVDLVHVPYKGSSPSFQDLIGGQVALTFDSLVQALPHIKHERLRALAVLGETRSPLLPDVPTVAEAGLPGYALTNWFGLVVPAATPRATVARLYADVRSVLDDRSIDEKLTAMGATVIGNTPEQFAAVLRSESARWARLIKEAAIRPE